MAEGTLSKLKDQLSCAVCLEVYTDPKQLLCNHVYCQSCLLKLVIRNKQRRQTITCPVCCQVTQVSANGVAGLQSAFNIKSLIDVMEEEEEVGGKAKTRCCFEHRDKPVEFYCKKCESLVCYKCIIKGGQHHRHSYCDLNEAFDKLKDKVASAMKPVEEKLKTLEEAMAGLTLRREEIHDQRAAVEADIHTTAKKLHEDIDTRRTELISQLYAITEQKMRDIAAQVEQIEHVRAQFESLHSIKQRFEAEDGSEFLLTKTAVLSQLKEMKDLHFQPDKFKPSASADLVFSSSADVITACQTYGHVATAGSLDPSQCHVLKATLATLEREATFTLHPVSFRGEPYTGDVRSWQCELVSKRRHAGARTVECSVKRVKDRYDISFKPRMLGTHLLHIRAEGRHVRGSPFTVVVTADAVSAAGQHRDHHKDCRCSQCEEELDKQWLNLVF